MSLNCVKCNLEIKAGDGYYNRPTGPECGDCGDQKKLGKWTVPESVLQRYINTVNQTRKFIYNPDPESVMDAQRLLTKRTELHKELFESVHLPYHTDDNATDESHEFNEALDELLGECQ